MSETPTAAIARTAPVTSPFATSCRNMGSDHLLFGHETAFREPGRVEDRERLVLAGAVDRLGDDPADGRREHEAVAAEARGNPQTVGAGHAPDDRLPVGSDVVHALDEER